MRIGYFVGGIVRRGDDGCGNKTLMDADAAAAAPLPVGYRQQPALVAWRRMK